MNPYKVLGISEDATQEEIRAAYLALVKKYHPDKYTDNPLKELANEKLKEINEAYELLTKKGTTACPLPPPGKVRTMTHTGAHTAAPAARIPALPPQNSHAHDLLSTKTTCRQPNRYSTAFLSAMRNGITCTASCISGKAGMIKPANIFPALMNRSLATRNTVTHMPPSTMPAILSGETQARAPGAITTAVPVVISAVRCYAWNAAVMQWAAACAEG